MLILGKIIFTNMFLFLSGKIFCKFLFKNKSKLDQSEIAIFGTIIVSFFALLINFFFPLDKITNTFILIVPLFFFFKYRLIEKKDFLFIF